MKLSEEWRVVNEAQKRIPVDVVGLAKELGLMVKEAFRGNDVSGMMEPFGHSYLIVINANDSRSRQRFTIAHELGHYMFHRQLIGDGLKEDCAYRSANSGKYFNSLIGPSVERQTR